MTQEFKQPLMPLLKALRKRKIALHLFEKTALAEQTEGMRRIEIYDLVQQYSVGDLSLDELVAVVLRRFELAVLS